MQWRRKPDGRPYADLREAGLGRRSLLSRSVLKEFGPTPSDDVCQRLYDDLLATLGPSLKASMQSRDFDIPQLVHWYVDVYKGTACQSTRDTALYHLNRWTEWCAKQSISMPDEFDSMKAQEFGAHLARKYRRGSPRSYMATVKALFNAATETGVLKHNPVGKWPSMPKAGTAVKYYTPEQLREVLAAVEKHQPRQYPVILFLAATGWSIGDACALEHSNIDRNRRVANRRRRKTGVPMMLPLNDTALEAIDRARTFTGKVFPMKKQKRPVCVVYDALQRAVAAAGIEYPCTLHMFRHTLAVELTRQGTPLAIVAQILGHDVKTTLEYYQTFAPGSGAPYLDSWGEKLKGDAEVCHPNVTPFTKAL